MTNFAKNCKSIVIPALRYRNAKTMIDWLSKAFGFEKQAVYFGPDDTVMHAQLTFGNGLIMVGSVENESPTSKLFRQPDEIGGRERQSAGLVASDIDRLYANAKATGAKIIADWEAKEYGGKAFACSDPEGHIWSFGTYDHWENLQP